MQGTQEYHPRTPRFPDSASQWRTTSRPFPRAFSRAERREDGARTGRAATVSKPAFSSQPGPVTLLPLGARRRKTAPLLGVRTSGPRRSNQSRRAPSLCAAATHTGSRRLGGLRECRAYQSTGRRDDAWARPPRPCHTREVSAGCKHALYVADLSWRRLPLSSGLIPLRNTGRLRLDRSGNFSL